MSSIDKYLELVSKEVELKHELLQIKQQKNMLEKKIWKECNHDWERCSAYNDDDLCKYMCKKCSLYNNHYLYT